MNNYKSLKHAKYLIQYHVVWCPKFRYNIIIGNIENSLKSIIQNRGDNMGWYFDNEELERKTDAINQLKEIEAYRELDGEDFDFGTGLIKNEMRQGSEDAYYEIDLQNLKDTIIFWEFNNKPELGPIKKIRPNHYFLKMIDKKR